MTNLIKTKHLAKANAIKPILNMDKLFVKHPTTCDWCKTKITKQPLVAHYGRSFCNDNCARDYYDHHLLPDIEQAREDRREQLEWRSNNNW